ncbi:MAG: hypothetical protein AAF488_15040 [Planctomycetota bacterium]
MPRSCLLLASTLALLFVAGCSGESPTETMKGRWVIDSETMKALDDYKNASPQEKTSMDMMMSAMVFEIGEKEIKMEVSMLGTTQGNSTPYTVASVSGNEVTLEMTEPNGEKKTGKISVAPDHLTLHDGKDTFTLKRAPKAEGEAPKSGG